MLEKLGKYLFEARESGEQSLASVAEQAKISPTYLQKLERGQVGSPSPRVLQRLAGTLEVGYLEMLLLAGYLSDEERREVQATPRLREEPHPLKDPKLTPDEWRAVGAFIRYLKAQRK
jgi:transcriptional regulator with XRE-family HTH domain